MNVNENIKKYRIKLGLTLEELGEKIGVTKPTIQRYEAGIIKHIPYDKIIQLSKIFGISADELLGWEETGNNKSPEDVEMEKCWKKLNKEQKIAMLEFIKKFR